MTTTFNSVIKKWDEDGQAGGKRINPLAPDDPAFWELGRAQAAEVAEYAEPGAFVIDFGCGIGRLSIPLVEAGYNVLAVDASQAMLDGLAARAAEAGVEVGSLRSDGSDLSVIVDHVVGERAAVVVCRSVLIHHDYASVERLVTALANVLETGGHLIADWPAAADGAAPHERRDWIDVTTWHPHHRALVAARASLDPVVEDAKPTVWRKREATS